MKQKYNLPSGFRAAGLHSGIGKKPQKPDLALFFSETPAAVAGVFTTNRVKAAPILVSMNHIKKGRAQAIIANSGCANACTGERGLNDANRMAARAAEDLGISKESVLVASTGVIGKFLPMDNVEQGIDAVVLRALSGGDGTQDAVHAIMTTDTVPKTAGGTLKIGSKTVTVWGCVKGAGMIHPDMATMFAFILTDARIASSKMRRMVKNASDASFNRLSVDGDTSTNDCVFLLANGNSGAELRSAKDLARFEAMLNSVCRSLAFQMAADGEGATKTLLISVEGAKSEKDAKKVAATIATSPLVKTAIFGEDANWGRIAAAAGRSGVKIDPDKIEVRFGPLCVCRNGMKADFSESAAKKILQKRTVDLTVHLHQGKHSSEYFTCDFSLDYVKINADYRT